MAEQRITRYRDFWPFYILQHSQPGTRHLHFIGTSGAIVFTVLSAVLPEAWLLLGVPLCGYFFSWAGHFFVEKNRQATFIYPIFSLIGDFHMYGMMWMGRMDSAVKLTAK